MRYTSHYDHREIEKGALVEPLTSMSALRPKQTVALATVYFPLLKRKFGNHTWSGYTGVANLPLLPRKPTLIGARSGVIACISRELDVG